MLLLKMKQYNYTLTTTQTASDAGSVSAQTISISGSNNVVFSLSGIDQSYSTVNKVIAEFPDRAQRVFTRNLTAANLSTISATNFEEIIESEVQEICNKDITFNLLRDDGFIDTHVLTFDVNVTNLADYTDINLIKSEYIATDLNDSNLILSFNADDPNITGINTINLEDLKGSKSIYYGSSATEVSSFSALISFHADTIITNASRSNLKGLVYRTGSDRERISVKYRTRVPAVTTELEYSDETEVYVPAIPNTTFFHVSGQLVWHANEEVQVKSFNVPLVDTLGAFTSSHNDAYFKNYFTSALQPISANYFFIDLYDLSGCNVELCDCATLTAYINY